MKIVYGIVAPYADLEYLFGKLDDTALSNSSDWPAKGTHLSMPTRAGDMRLLAHERMPSP